MSFINRGAVLFAVILSVSLFLFNANASVPGGYGIYQSTSPEPCLYFPSSSASGSYFFPQEDCGSIVFTPASQVQAGSTPTVTYTMNTVSCGVTSTAGCNVILVFRPPGLTTTYNYNLNPYSLPERDFPPVRG